MSNNLSPYLVFSGETREALEFYRSVFGGKVEIMPFGAMGDSGDFPADAAMHGQLDTEAGWTIMAADSTKPGDAVVRGGSTMCVWGDELETLSQQFDKLAEGGTVTTALAKQTWGDTYGDLTDRFGIAWGFNISGASQ